MLRRIVFSGLLLVAPLLAGPAAAGPVLLDRVVAIVDDRGIFRSEVIARANREISQLELRERSDAKKTEVILKATLAKMIDELIISKETQRIHISVDDAEVEHAIELIGKRFSMSRAELMDAVKKQGMTEAEYRTDLRRQILEGKWVQLRVTPKVKEQVGGTEEERAEKKELAVEAEKKKQLAQLRAESFVEVHW